MTRQLKVGAGVLLLLVLVPALVAQIERPGGDVRVAGPVPKSHFLEVGKGYTFSWPHASLSGTVVEEPRDNWVKVKHLIAEGKEAVYWINLTTVLHVMADLEVKVETGSVKGTIALDGKPIEKGRVAFHPEKGKAVEADIRDGAFSAGEVPVGLLRVTINTVGAPTRYADRNKTPLVIEVKKGENPVSVQLTK
jgi:hypothetical protein